MFRFRLPADRYQVELVANGIGPELTFQVLGPTTEVAYVEELIISHFGSLTVLPKNLFVFLQNDPWILEIFKNPVVLSGDLDAIDVRQVSVFNQQPLGEKLVEIGVLDQAELNQLLADYQPYAGQQRFGEFLRLNLRISEPMLRFLLDPSFFEEKGFNQKRLGERLLELGFIDQPTLESALSQQKKQGGLLGEILAEQGALSPIVARFFSRLYFDSLGEIQFKE